MSKTAVFIWLSNVLADTSGHIAFKRAATIESDDEWHRWKAMLSSPPIWIGIFCFVLELFLWLALVSLVPLSLAALLAAFNIASVVLAAKWVYRETISPIRLAGIVCIVIGVALGSTGL
ncbi:EamA family transporter [Dyella acidisoli]|uniref:EamA domain-containing protein n=1 Tax=Dyella acidisoli TaxID=1867834 RepID=A0ABQ5XVE7_9GAMM|nr:EamA family transporter [Dyella acidisoli]GLQ94380.1 hypothetical protein GCM10007901_33320 [Dyella acidisoli]